MTVWTLRRYRKLFMEAEVEPATKDSRAGSRNAAELQRQVMDYMERFRLHPMTGPVALDLYFRAARKNPPSIHKAAKHALDALVPTLPCNVRPRRRHVLYRDDRQVKFLYVDLDQAWTREESPRSGSIFITARRARDVMADLYMAARISHEDYDEYEDSPFRMGRLPDEPEQDWLTEPGANLTPAERYLADFARFRYVTDLQEATLAGTDAILASGLSLYLGDLNRTNASEELTAIFEKSQVESRALLLSNPLMPPLPGLPRAKGQSRDFARLIRARLVEFRSRWPALPVTLTFLVIPPEQVKDLDNIALEVLPIAHEVLRPHIEPHLQGPLYRGEEPEPWREEDAVTSAFAGLRRCGRHLMTAQAGRI